MHDGAAFYCAAICCLTFACFCHHLLLLPIMVHSLLCCFLHSALVQGFGGYQLGGGYGTEDESGTPARRRYQQRAAAAAVAAAAAAKEQGGVQRSIKFPPLGGGTQLAGGSGMLRGYGSSAQVGRS